jgi:hypothetical protein
LSLAVTAILMLVLSAGDFSRFAPSEIAAHLPLFSSFRIPSRYTVGVALFAAVTIGWVRRRSLSIVRRQVGRGCSSAWCTVAVLSFF